MRPPKLGRSAGCWTITGPPNSSISQRSNTLSSCFGRLRAVGNPPNHDPTPFLAAKITETPRFADPRSAFVRSIVAQRAAAMGISALLSSSIELEAHQVEVVRRVLQDPVQRYLLADEVGLGKTVEAGVLIRQCFLDGGPDTQVVVLAPSSLVTQWRSELASKFFSERAARLSLQVFHFQRTDRCSTDWQRPRCW